MHPRLFTTLVLIDPVIQLYSTTAPELGPNPARLSTFRRDIWPSREEAAKGFKASKFYQSWDSRVLDRWIQYGLRNLPTMLHPLNGDQKSSQVTLTTPLHQEVFTFLRPNYEGYGTNGKPVNRKTHPDLNPNLPVISPFYRAEPPAAFFRLQELRPSVLYVFGGKSDVGTPQNCKAKMDNTGVGVGGSGGVASGRVKSVLFEDIGHLIAMEAVDRTADNASEWIGNELKLWCKDEEEHRRNWDSKSLVEKQTVDAQWKKMMGGPVERKPKQPKL